MESGSDLAMVDRANSGLAYIEVRDRVLVYAVNRRISLPLVSIPTHTVRHHMDTAGDTVPDMARIWHVFYLCEICSQVATATDVAGLATAGYLAWWSGHGPLAYALTSRAIRSNPSYALASLVMKALRVDLQPPWMRG